MSIDIDWERLTEDGAALEEVVRDFLDRQFKQLKLPEFIESISVNHFSLGTVAPEVTIKHISDPYPEFYQEDDNGSSGASGSASYTNGQYTANDEAESEGTSSFPPPPTPYPPDFRHLNGNHTQVPPAPNDSYPFPTNDRSSFSPSLPSYTSEVGEVQEPLSESLLPDTTNPHDEDVTPLSMQRLSPSPPITPNGSSWHYFHPLPSNILSGVRSPFYASLPMSISRYDTNSNNSTRVPTTSTPVQSQTTPLTNPEPETQSPDATADVNEKSDEDFQLFLKISYKGDMTLGLTATLLLNYPSPRFVSLPLKLVLTNLEINSMAVLAHVSRRIHFSFVCDVGDNGETLLGDDHIDIIKNVKIESEIGDQGEHHGPVLRNVDKVERFLLERIRAIARDELAWPGWITFEY